VRSFPAADDPSGGGGGSSYIGGVTAGSTETGIESRVMDGVPPNTGDTDFCGGSGYGSGPMAGNGIVVIHW
jgi:hypothetical protein